MKRLQSIVAFIAIALATSSVLMAQGRNQAQQNPPVETHYMIDFTAYRVTDPGISFGAEWALTPEWVLAGEAGVGYAMLYSFATDSRNGFFIDDGIAARWYVNRARRARLGKTIRKNSGFYLDFGLKHMYSSMKEGKRSSYEYYSSDYYRTEFSYTSHSNILGLYIGAGSKLVSKSNIYFSWKVGLGYGINLESNPTTVKVSPTLLPVCDIRVGYCF